MAQKYKVDFSKIRLTKDGEGLSILRIEYYEDANGNVYYPEEAEVRRAFLSYSLDDNGNKVSNPNFVNSVIDFTYDPDFFNKFNFTSE
jgi:hypothetical protein